MKYRIFISDEPAGATDWLPIAQAAWNCAVAQLGAEVALMIDGQVVCTVTPRRGQENHPWPVCADHVTDLRDVAKAVLALARAAGVSGIDVADGMTAQGLPTSRSRLKHISTAQERLQAGTTPAEIVAMCYGAIGALKQ